MSSMIGSGASSIVPLDGPERGRAAGAAGDRGRRHEGCRPAWPATCRRVGAEPVAVGAGADHGVDELVDARSVRTAPAQLVEVAIGDGGALGLLRLAQEAVQQQVVDDRRVGVGALPAGDQRQLGEDLVLVGPVGFEQRRRPVGEVAHRERVEGQSYSLRSSGDGGGRITLACRVVSLQVDVDADHEVELIERGVEAAAVRASTCTGLPAMVIRAPDLALARRLDLVGQRGDRELAAHLGEVLHPAAVAARCGSPRPGPALAAPLVGGRGEHGAAGTVEVAGERR